MHLDGLYSTISSSRESFFPLASLPLNICISATIFEFLVCYSKALYARLVVSNELSLAKYCSGKVISKTRCLQKAPLIFVTSVAV